MKKSTYLIVFVCLALIANATHNRGGEILYKRIAPYSTGVGSSTVEVFTFSITVIKYTDNDPMIADRCVDTVYFGDGTSGIAPRINGSTGCCGSFNGVAIGCGDIILNSPGYVVKKNIYSLVHTYSGTGNYIVSSKDPNRNAGVINIQNSDNYPFCISSLIVIKSFISANSSPVLTLAPMDQGSLNACFYHNPGAIDADGDSLSYDLMNCQCALTYSLPATGPGGYLSINANGTLTWCEPQQMGEYNTAMIIKEWRKNQVGVYEVIGYVIRDRQILVTTVYQGLTEQTKNKGFQISPNPCSNWLQLNLEELPAGQDLFIYNLNGQIVYRSKVQNQREMNLDVSTLLPGIYVIELRGREGISFKKFSKN